MNCFFALVSGGAELRMNPIIAYGRRSVITWGRPSKAISQPVRAPYKRSVADCERIRPPTKESLGNCALALPDRVIGSQFYFDHPVGSRNTSPHAPLMTMASKPLAVPLKERAEATPVS